MNRAELYYEIAHNRVEEQNKRRQYFSTIVTTILGFAGALVAIMAFTVSEWARWSIYPAIGVLVSFVGVAIFTILALWLRAWYFQPPLDDLYAHMDSGKYEDEALVIWSAKQMSNAVKLNNSSLDQKADWLRIAHICLILEVVMLAILIFSVVA